MSKLPDDLPLEHFVQDECDVEPVCGLYHPAPQGLQGPVPGSSEYVPMGHTVQKATPLELVFPTGQGVNGGEQ